MLRHEVYSGGERRPGREPRFRSGGRRGRSDRGVQPQPNFSRSFLTVRAQLQFEQTTLHIAARLGETPAFAIIAKVRIVSPGTGWMLAMSATLPYGQHDCKRKVAYLATILINVLPQWLNVGNQLGAASDQAADDIDGHGLHVVGGFRDHGIQAGP